MCVSSMAPVQFGNPKLANHSWPPVGWQAIYHNLDCQRCLHAAYPAIDLPTLKSFAMDWKRSGVVSFYIVMAILFSTDKDTCIATVCCYMDGASSAHIAMKMFPDMQKFARHWFSSQVVMICSHQWLLIFLAQKHRFMAWSHFHICPVAVCWPALKTSSVQQLLLQTRSIAMDYLLFGSKCTHDLLPHKYCSLTLVWIEVVMVAMRACQYHLFCSVLIMSPQCRDSKVYKTMMTYESIATDGGGSSRSATAVQMQWKYGQAISGLSCALIYMLLTLLLKFCHAQLEHPVGTLLTTGRGRGIYRHLTGKRHTGMRGLSSYLLMEVQQCIQPLLHSTDNWKEDVWTCQFHDFSIQG